MNYPDQSEEQLKPLLTYVQNCRSLLLCDKSQINIIPNSWRLAQRSLWMILWLLPYYLFIDYNLVFALQQADFQSYMAEIGVSHQLLYDLSFSLVYLLYAPIFLIVVYYISKTMVIDQNYPRWLVIYQSLMILTYITMIFLETISMIIPVFGIIGFLLSIIMPFAYSFFSLHYVLKLDKMTSIMLTIAQPILFLSLMTVMIFS